MRTEVLLPHRGFSRWEEHETRTAVDDGVPSERAEAVVRAVAVLDRHDTAGRLTWAGVASASATSRPPPITWVELLTGLPRSRHAFGVAFFPRDEASPLFARRRSHSRRPHRGRFERQR